MSAQKELLSIIKCLIRGKAEDYCPPCTKDLPLPGEGEEQENAGTPEPGTLEEGVYSQPFWDLRLIVDESWTVYSREEINEEYYRGVEMSMKTAFRIGVPFMDLVMNRGADTVQILLERAPVQTDNGIVCSDPETYMDSLAQTLPELLEGYGLESPSARRYQTEICGRSYEVVSVTGKVGWTRLTQAFYCTERDGVFLSISLVVTGADNCDELLAELLAEPGA